tara:strand:- start:842 stop:961 length:120 start_codon:yes stop_codon:yes gene_type:complete
MTEEEFGEWIDEYIGLGLSDEEKGRYYEMFIFGMRWARA